MGHANHTHLLQLPKNLDDLDHEKAAEWTSNGVIEGRGRLKQHKNRAEIERLLHIPRASAYETATQTDPLAVSHSHCAQRSLDIQHYQKHAASLTEPVSRKRAPTPLNPQERKDKDTTVPLKKRNHNGYRIDKPRPKSTELRPSPPILLPALPTAPPPPTPTTAAVALPNPTPLTTLPVATPQEEELSLEQDDTPQNDATPPNQGDSLLHDAPPQDPQPRKKKRKCKRSRNSKEHHTTRTNKSRYQQPALCSLPAGSIPDTDSPLSIPGGLRAPGRTGGPY